MTFALAQGTPGTRAHRAAAACAHRRERANPCVRVHRPTSVRGRPYRLSQRASHSLACECRCAVCRDALRSRSTHRSAARLDALIPPRAAPRCRHATSLDSRFRSHGCARRATSRSAAAACVATRAVEPLADAALRAGGAAVFRCAVPACRFRQADHAGAPAAADADRHRGTPRAPRARHPISRAPRRAACNAACDSAHRTHCAQALCNDGSNASFYFAQATVPKLATTWVLYLEGGGWCEPPSRCTPRFAVAPQGCAALALPHALPATSPGATTRARARRAPRRRPG
jgi:hypothetical protein